MKGKILTFQIGSGMFGVPLEWVCAVESTVSSGGRSGTCLFRGEELPLIDLAAFFGCEAESGGNLLILGEEGAEAAALVDSPGVAAPSREVYKLPDLCQSFVGETFSGVFLRDDALILMVDPKQLCREGGRVRERVAGGGDGR